MSQGIEQSFIMWPGDVQWLVALTVTEGAFESQQDCLARNILMQGGGIVK